MQRSLLVEGRADPLGDVCRRIDSVIAGMPALPRFAHPSRESDFATAMQPLPAHPEGALNLSDAAVPAESGRSATVPFARPAPPPLGPNTSDSFLRVRHKDNTANNKPPRAWRPASARIPDRSAIYLHNTAEGSPVDQTALAYVAMRPRGPAHSNPLGQSRSSAGQPRNPSGDRHSLGLSSRQHPAATSSALRAGDRLLRGHGSASVGSAGGGGGGAESLHLSDIHVPSEATAGFGASSLAAASLRQSNSGSIGRGPASQAGGTRPLSASAARYYASVSAAADEATANVSLERAARASRLRAASRAVCLWRQRAQDRRQSRRALQVADLQVDVLA